MNPDKIFITVNDRRVSLSAFAKMEKTEIKTLDASGCTALTAIDAPAAKTLYASGCTALTAVDAPAAEYLYASGCTALTAIDAPAAKTLYASGCTALTAIIHAGEDRRGYHFFAYPIAGVYRVFAGCRNFTLADAREHWGPGGESDRADCLALVEIIATEIAKREASARAALATAEDRPNV